MFPGLFRQERDRTSVGHRRKSNRAINCSARLKRILAPKRSLVNTLIGMSQQYEKFLSATA
jgi:hypothetical protein